MASWTMRQQYFDDFPRSSMQGPDPTIRHHCQDLLVGGRNSKHHLMYWDLLLDLLGLLTLTVGFLFMDSMGFGIIWLIWDSFGIYGD